MRKNWICISLIVLGLAACDPPDTAEKHAGDKYSNGQVALAAVAPDGTKLWVVKAWGDPVYFSSGGVQWSHSCGKNCVKTEHVPNVKNEDDSE